MQNTACLRARYTCSLSMRTCKRFVWAICRTDILANRELRAQRLLRAWQRAVDGFCMGLWARKSLRFSG
jgi:hypothetical protein